MAVHRIKEDTGAIYTATLRDAAGEVLPLSAITTITLTLYDVDSGTIINARDGQDVKNANNVVIHATSGLLTWLMQAADNAIIGADADVPVRSPELHRALFEFAYTGNGSPGKHEVEFHVDNLDKV